MLDRLIKRFSVFGQYDSIMGNFTRALEKLEALKARIARDQGVLFAEVDLCQKRIDELFALDRTLVNLTLKVEHNAGEIKRILGD